MDKITLNAAQVEQLRNLESSIDVCDEAGNVIGFYSPKIDPSEYDWGPELSEEEIQRRLDSKAPRYSTAEVLRRLGRL
jgi:hypothetical protein